MNHSTKMAAALGLLVVVALLAATIAGCAGPTPASTKPVVAATAQAPAATVPAAAATKPTGAATSAPAAAATAAPAAKIKRGGSLRTAVQTAWVTLDPSLFSNEETAHMMYADPLFFWRPDGKGSWSSVPAMAEGYDFPQPNQAILKLRKGIKFHDGTDWNAKTAKWNFDRWLTHQKSAAKPYLDCVDKAKGAEIVDDYTVKVNLTGPCASFIASLSPAGTHGVYPISQAALEKAGDDAFGIMPIAAGPFQVADFQRDQLIKLKKFPNYYLNGADGQPLPYLDEITYRLIIEDSVRLLELRSGNIDFVDMTAPRDVPLITKDPKLVFLEDKQGGMNYRISMSAKEGPQSKNFKLRQAILTAFDRDAIVKTLAPDVGITSKYMMLPNMLGYDASVPFYWYDKAKATQLLTEAGFPNGLNITFDVISRQIDRQQAEVMKAMLDAVGIKTELIVLEKLASNARTNAGTYNITTGRNPTRWDSDLLMTSFLTEKGSQNITQWSNPELEKCIVEGRSTYDAKQRHETYKKCQTIQYNDAYWGFLWFHPHNWAMQSYVKGFIPSWGFLWELREVWLDK
jgi:ABC-type transport system substrate-binding protein